MIRRETVFSAMDSNEKRKILLVDDNKINLSILDKILSTDYDTVSAFDGQEAMDILNSEKGGEISAVILDLLMPVMDGYEVLRRMRSDENFSKIPVIVVSGDTTDESREATALALGANDYLSKPYKPDIIRRRIANTIYLHETASFVNTVQHDSLTGIYSKEYFYLQAEKILKLNPDKKYDLICCDVDKFKLVNDLYGTAVGDVLLKNCAKEFALKTANDGICGRIGGDIFAVLILRRDKYDDKYFSLINDIVNGTGISLNISLRFGIYEIDDTSVPVRIMCDRACLAIASIKGMYNTYYKFYDESTRKKLMDEQYIIANMETALNEKQFEVYYQPKYELKSEKAVGAEALVRWNNPQKGLMSPADFIPLFEKNGFITELDIYVWESCCRLLRRRLDEGKMVIPVSVNVSRTDIYNPNIAKILISLMKKYKLSPQYFFLEITESAYTEDSQQLIETVSYLKKLGFIIEMDDFGTGYSSLNMLSELPIDVVKLDLRFMKNHEKYNGRSVMSFIVSLAKWMDLKLIAEGVETQEQVDFLRSLNCEYAQGYYYAKPMPQADFERLLDGEINESTVKKVFTAGDSDAQTGIYHPETILVLDNTLDDYKRFEKMFSSDNSVESISSAAQAEKIAELGMEEISVIICVVDSGIRVKDLKGILDKASACDIPVITVHTSPSTVEEAIELGACDCIMKPYNDRAIKNRINNAIGSALMARFEKENEINAAIREMKKRAERDYLTSLLNRAEFENRIEEFFVSPLHSDAVFIMLDIDNFKLINDNYGHLTGDGVLQSAALCIKNIFSETEFVGRIGGDEFALLLPYKLEEKEMLSKLERLCSMDKMMRADAPVTCSVGVSCAPLHGEDFQSLYEAADIALLTAKRRGKGCYTYYVQGMETPIDEKLEKRARELLDNTSDAMFVCDAVSSEIIYINDTACKIVGESKSECLGKRCYQLFWERRTNCERCPAIDNCADHFYEEDTTMKNGITPLHIKAKLDTWDGRKVKLHYLQKG